MCIKSTSPQPVMYRAKHLQPRQMGELPVDARHQDIPGYQPEVLSSACIDLIGAGGLGGEIGEGLARKGVGTLTIFDHDVVDLTNLNRQRFFEDDLGKPKAHCLARNLATEGFLGTTIVGYNLSFQDAVTYGIDPQGTLAIVGVDNNPCRVAASRYYRQRCIPVIFTAVSEDASHGYVFVQEPEGSCFGCLFPKALDDETYPCATPAVKDILKVVAGIVTYAVDTILMERLRLWQYKTVYLDGSIPGFDWQVARRDDCKLCQSGQLVTV